MGRPRGESLTGVLAALTPFTELSLAPGGAWLLLGPPQGRGGLSIELGVPPKLGPLTELSLGALPSGDLSVGLLLEPTMGPSYKAQRAPSAGRRRVERTPTIRPVRRGLRGRSGTPSVHAVAWPWALQGADRLYRWEGWCVASDRPLSGPELACWPIVGCWATRAELRGSARSSTSTSWLLLFGAFGAPINACVMNLLPGGRKL
eukprot:CAMPEP_0114541754 /NCGR_PEP_ID=MMETSP0114-20121206/1471_1 /TAXON_ID=31324 /ORGANISM="Goniomonas sp, Strain m" /LENGTH=203 /DNA_ID=CAMNT_0001726007 /DNA_START=467 /DNA_END=1078 /DNA_ORIENTATION=-